MIVRPLDDVLAQYPDFVAGWKPLANGGFANPKYGSIEHVVVCHNDGRPIYDQPRAAESSGVIIVPYDIQQGIIRVGLIAEERPVAGKTFLQVPMGFVNEGEGIEEAAFREVMEEANLQPEQVEHIGYTNHAPTYYTTRQPIVAARVDEITTHAEMKGDGLENITGIAPYTAGQLRQARFDPRFESGPTLAALAIFGLYKPEFFANE